MYIKYTRYNHLILIFVTFYNVLYFNFSLYAPESLGMPKLKPGKKDNLVNGEVSNLECSFFILDPVRRKEIWRFVTYMFLHGNHQHIGYNILMQLLIGKWHYFK